MKVNYMGHRITVERDRCRGGWELLYWSIARLDDATLLANGQAQTENTIPEQIEALKERITDELATDDPWGEKGLTELPTS